MILGLTGSFGAGKGAVVEYLIHTKGFVHYSARAFIVMELEKRSIPINRDSMIAMGNEFREKYGPGHIIESLAKEALGKSENAVIESLRAVGEVESIKRLGGFVLGVDADPDIRYKRAMLRGSEADGVSFEKWQTQEKQENNTSDPTKQNIFGALQLSDVVIQNNGSFEELYAQIDTALSSFSIKK